MKIVKEITSLDEFEFWSGAKSRYDAIYELGKADELFELLEELFPDGATETQINDFVWFDLDEDDYYLEMLGISRDEWEACF